MIDVAVYGCGGKMGQRVVAAVTADADCRLTAVFEQEQHALIGQACGGLTVSADLALLSGAQVVIDFSAAAATPRLAAAAAQCAVPLVIGTTGLTAAARQTIQDAARSIAIVFSPNMAVGVNVLFGLVQQAARKLGGYTPAISEAHHVHKKDAPSGTAKQLAAIIEAEIKKPVTDITAVREGEIIGDHSIRFESDVDVLELRHSAKTRDIFARGAVTAAKWVAQQKPGLYSMRDVLGL